MLNLHSFVSFLLLTSATLSTAFRHHHHHRHHRIKREDVHLAVHPRCEPLSGEYWDLNAGVDLDNMKTIVSFGDSYTSGEYADGSPLPPAVLYPPYPLAGGRSTNGILWIEHIANAHNSTLLDYAQAGACTDLSLWPSNPNKFDFIGQVKRFQSQNRSLDPSTTLYSAFFGINDFVASFTDGDHMQEAAHSFLKQISILAAPPTNARNFMVLDVYGRGTVSDRGEKWKKTIFDGMNQFHLGINPTTSRLSPRLNFAFVDIATIFNGVFSSNPGYQAFGYTSRDACIRCTSNGCDMTGMCDDPDHYFQWYPGHPSKETMRIMAEYVEEVFKQCRPSVTISGSIRLT